MDNQMYTVFVGGAEVNDNLLTLEQANRLADEYAFDGYDDVCVVPEKAIKLEGVSND
jgi:hypothetical protein